MIIVDHSDIQIFVSISILLFLVLFIIWSASNWLNVFLKVTFFGMVLFGTAVLFFAKL